MFRARVVLMVGALIAMLVVFVSTASAKIAFEWKVKGAALAAGQSRDFTVSAESNLDLKGTLAGSAILLLASKVKVGSGAKIFGGKPGTGEGEVVFENVTSDKPANCEVESLKLLPGGGVTPVGTVVTAPLKGEIVEGQTSHEPLLLFTPKVGTVFTTLRFLGANCLFKNEEAGFTGSVLATPLPELKEVLTGLLDFEPSQGNVFLLSTGGAAETAGLSFAEKPATIGGNGLATLVSDEVAGAF